ncbi:MAG: homoserine dehydrogenase [Alphaproteobacteria bacterium]|nr:homoserine dehydrogenase [Alphaproteobacteria bacterium]
MPDNNENIKNIGIAGLGTVGCGLVSLIEQTQKMLQEKGQPLLPLKIVAVSAQNKNKKRDIDCANYQWFDDPQEMAKSPDIDILIELIGGEYGIAEQIIDHAIQSGKAVITANKALLARKGFEIAQTAQNQKTTIGWEAAVGGVIPIIANLCNHLIYDKIDSLSGILNGTCNYILTKMQNDKINFADALNDAQKLGLAEADPTLDVSGVDAAQKLALIAAIAFQIKPNIDKILVEGIENIQYQDIEFAQSQGYRIKLIAEAIKIEEKIYLSVSPVLLAISAPLAHIDNELNGLIVNSLYAGATMLTGPGAGASPTAVAVMSDLIHIIRHPDDSNQLFGTDVKYLSDTHYYDYQQYSAQYFIRVRVKDIAGVLSDMMAVMKEYGISIDMLIQRNSAQRREPDAVSLQMITHNVRAQVVNAALEKISALSFVIEKPIAIKLAK